MRNSTSSVTASRAEIRKSTRIASAKKLWAAVSQISAACFRSNGSAPYCPSATE